MHPPASEATLLPLRTCKLGGAHLHPRLKLWVLFFEKKKIMAMIDLNNHDDLTGLKPNPIKPSDFRIGFDARSMQTFPTFGRLWHMITGGSLCVGGFFASFFLTIN